MLQSSPLLYDIGKRDVQTRAGTGDPLICGPECYHHSICAVSDIASVSVQWSLLVIRGIEDLLLHVYNTPYLDPNTYE